MYELRRISLANWNLMTIQDIELQGTTALIGAVGVGKSTILDAIQTVFSGNMSSKLRLNRAASMGTGKSKRTVRDYCLGITEETLEKESFRRHCHTILVLTFQSSLDQRFCAVGLVIEADIDKTGEEMREKFVAPECDFSFEAFADRDPDGNLLIESYERIIEKIRARSGRHFQSSLNATGQNFIKAYLAAMKPFGAQPDVDTFTRRFRNAIAFEEITDPDRFIKDFVLEEDAIDTERLRRNLAAWDELAQTIERLEQKLRDARQVRSRYVAAVSQDVEIATARAECSYFKTLLNAQERKARREAIEEGLRQREQIDVRMKVLNERIGAETDRLGQDQAIAQLDRDSGHQLRDAAIKGIEAEMRSRLAEVRDLPRLLHGLLESQSLDQNLPAHVKDARAQAAQIRRLIREDPGRLVAQDPESDLQGALQEIRKSARFLTPLETMRDHVVEELGRASSRVSELRRELAQIGAGSSPLSPAQEAFRRRLKSDYGIHARVLAEVVDLREGMMDWALALETVLGAHRRAFFVDPEDVEAALRHLDMGREEYGGEVTLIDTRKIERQWEHRTQDLPYKAIVDIVTTEDRHVQMFLRLQYGRIQMAEDLAELRRLENGVTRTGTRAQRFSYTTVRLGRRRPELGRRGSEMARHDREEELQLKSRLLRDLQGQLEAMQALGQTLREVAALDLTAIAVAQQGLRDLHRQLQEQKAARVAEAAPEVAEALLRIDARKARIAALRRELDQEDSGARRGIEKEIGRNETLLESLEKEKTLLEAQLQRELDWENAPAIRLALSAFDAMGGERQGRPELPGARLAQLEQETRFGFDLAGAHHRAEERLTELNRTEKRAPRARSDFQAFITSWRDSTPPPEPELSAQFAWLVELVNEIEQNELLPHKARIVKIQQETNHEVREIFITQLHDKFSRVREIVRQLNRRLRNHRFGGQTYVFSQKENPEMGALLRLVREVSRNPREAEQILSVSGGEFDEALSRIREIFRASGNAGLYEDYRQYYRFDLAITNEALSEADLDKLETGEMNGPRLVTNLTQRLGTGSGGQKQTPYYVAIAASMAAAYHPGNMREAQEGMGLVCFDEAFSKLDIQSTQALIRFFKDLGLQIVVAAPEEKRASFMELMDTIVNITKAPGEDDLFIDVETIGAAARQALWQSNPEHIGIEGFREALARDAGAAPQSPAQENE